MTDAEKLDRFLAAVAGHPDTSSLGAMLVPYRAMAGSAEDVVSTLDLLASMWEEAKR